jgi:ankyrin repeat protein
MIDEEAEFRQRRDQWFADVERGDEKAIYRSLGQKPLTDFRGDKYEWVTMTASDGRTAFIVAAAAGHVAALRLLAGHGADVLAKDSAGENALHAATVHNHVHAMHYLVTELHVPIDSPNPSLKSPLHKAVDAGHLQAMKLLLELKADVNLVDKYKTTSLVHATKHAKHDACALLLHYGASLDIPDNSKKCPPEYADERATQLFWFHAAGKGEVRGLRQLLARQIGAQGDEGFRELNRALYHPRGQDTMKLNLHRILCNARRGSDGATALSVAVQGAHVDAVTYLLSQTADATLSDDMRETPLHHACRLGHLQLVTILIDENAPLEALNWANAAPLHVACFLNHHTCARALLTAKANVHLTDKEHQTPMHLAVLERAHETVQVLLAFGASLSATDRHHRTVGDRAAEASQNEERPRPRRPEDVADYDRKYEPPKAPEPYVVCHSKMVAVRASPSLQGQVIGARAPGETVMVVAVEDGWAKLESIHPHGKPHRADTKRTKDMEAWMLVDATEQGLGKLLEPAPKPGKPAAASGSGRAQGSDNDDDDDDSDFEG